MGRKRKDPSTAWMPPRVRMGKSAYEFRTSDGRTLRLCDRDKSRSEVWGGYEKLLENKKNEKTFNKLCKDFISSADFKELAAETQKDYLKYSDKVNKAFGDMNPDLVRPEHIRKYMDLRGVKSRTQANREKAFMSRVYRWAYERGLVKANPCKGVRQFK